LVGREIELLPSGQVVTLDRPSMAGSALSMNRAVVVFAKFRRADLPEALQAAATNPGRLLRRNGVCTDLVTGQWANLVLFRGEPDDLRVETVLLRGEQVYALK
jgi:N-acetylglucosamine-6-phosphate deacetylase